MIQKGELTLGVIYSGPEESGRKLIHSGEGELLTLRFHLLQDEDISPSYLFIEDAGFVGPLAEGFVVEILPGFEGGPQELRKVTVGPKTRLLRLSPNPTRASAKIEFSLEKDEEIYLKVYNASGRLVVNLYQGREKAGWHTINWNVEVPQGVYFVVLKAGDYQGTRRLVKMK